MKYIKIYSNNRYTYTMTTRSMFSPITMYVQMRKRHDAKYGQYTEDHVQQLIERIQNDDTELEQPYEQSQEQFNRFMYILGKEPARFQELFGIDKLTTFQEKFRINMQIISDKEMRRRTAEVQASYDPNKTIKKESI